MHTPKATRYATAFFFPIRRNRDDGEGKERHKSCQAVMRQRFSRPHSNSARMTAAEPPRSPRQRFVPTHFQPVSV